MSHFKNVLFIVFVWIISFISPSGFAQAYHLPELIDKLILFVSVIIYFKSRKGVFQLKGILIFGIILSFIIIPFITCHSREGASYLVSILIIYCFSKIGFANSEVKYSALIIGALGLGVLTIYCFSSILSGWNDNAIAMTGLFSFLYYAIYLHTLSRRGWKFLLYNIVTIFYTYLLLETDCRSAALFLIITLVTILFQNKTLNIVKKRYFNFLLINFPLLIALLVILLSQTSLYQELNYWSIAKFDKEIFNGRDIIWMSSWDTLIQTYWLGIGEFHINYHNSAMACLAVFGIVGYLSWAKLFRSILRFLQQYIFDSVVFGCMVSFCLIFAQQSVDLGFIAPHPNMLPYLILGLAYGRIKYITDGSRNQYHRSRL